ncbi:MAG: DUF2946 domain-containing protein [Zoogloeaceae bacterium]|jgi:hypothetical protein|nr:DUF2946 domain-containing protein [Zoogloeaceae bacterium]
MRFHDLRSPRFAILAILLLALRLAGGAGVALLASDAHGGNTNVICTAMGVSMLEVAANTSSEPPPESSHYAMGAHCPFCLAGHDALVLPSADFSFPPPEPAATAFLPPFSSGSQPPLPDSRHAPTRAPPSFA